MDVYVAPWELVTNLFFSSSIACRSLCSPGSTSPGSSAPLTKPDRNQFTVRTLREVEGSKEEGKKEAARERKEGGREGRRGGDGEMKKWRKELHNDIVHSKYPGITSQGRICVLPCIERRTLYCSICVFRESAI